MSEGIRKPTAAEKKVRDEKLRRQRILTTKIGELDKIFKSMISNVQQRKYLNGYKGTIKQLLVKMEKLI